MQATTDYANSRSRSTNNNSDITVFEEYTRNTANMSILHSQNVQRHVMFV